MAKKVDRESLYSTFDKLNESPGYHMMMVVNKWDRGISGVLDGYNLTRPQLEILACMVKLTRDGRPVTQKDVADFIRRDKNTVSGILRTLEKKGYVKRAMSKDDQRAKSIVLTDEGFRMMEKAAGEVLRFDERFFHDGGDRRELKGLLKEYL